MKAFIYRHADAVDGAPDEQRKLSSKGRKQAKGLAKALPASEFEEIAEIWHSPLVRAEETASIFKKNVSTLNDVSLFTVHELEPAADVHAMGQLLGECEGDVITCGHNPFLEELITLLCAGEAGQGLLKLKKGGMLCLARTTEASQNIPCGLWSIEWYLTPKLIS